MSSSGSEIQLIRTVEVKRMCVVNEAMMKTRRRINQIVMQRSSCYVRKFETWKKPCSRQ